MQLELFLLAVELHGHSAHYQKTFLGRVRVNMCPKRWPRKSHKKATERPWKNPRSHQAKTSYGVYHFLGKRMEKGLHHRPRKKCKRRRGLRSQKQKKGGLLRWWRSCFSLPCSTFAFLQHLALAVPFSMNVAVRSRTVLENKSLRE